MAEVWQLLIGILTGLVLVWLLLVLILWRESRRHRGGLSLKSTLRLVPDVVRLLRRLVRDPTVPKGVRVWLALLLIYLISPIDLIPDFIPLLGYADDALIVALAIRFVTHRAGSAAVLRHWPGTADGLNALLQFAGLTASA